MCAFSGVESRDASASLGGHTRAAGTESAGLPLDGGARAGHSLFSLAALFYFQYVNGERCSGAVQRPGFRNSLIS
jgi:hypothetical protein